MAAGNETITLRLVAQDLMTGNVTKAIASIDKLARRGGIVGSVMQGVGQSFGQMLNPVGLVTRGIGALTDTLGDSIKAFNDDALSQKKLRTALEANIQGWDGNTKAVEDLIASRARLGFSDDEQRDSLALLVAQVGDLNDALAIQRTAMDLARLKGMGLAEASTVLSKAYLGSTTALQKMGIKLAKGTDGLDAIAAVQQRAAGQAQAYSETMVGAAEVMAISFDEFKESVGGALVDALTPFFNLVVDLTNQAPDLDNALGRLTQQYRDMIDVKAEAIQQDSGWDDEVTGLLQSVFMPQDKAIHDLTGTLSDYQRILGVTRKDLALFAEAGFTAGKSADDIRAALDMLVAQQVAERGRDIGYAWQTGMTMVSVAAEQAGESIYGGLVKPVKSAFRAMFATMASQKEPWKAAWREMAAYAKDPFRPHKFENWLANRADKAVQKAKQAAADGKPEVAARWRALAAVMRRPVLAALAKTEEDIQSLVDAMLVMQAIRKKVGGYRRNGSTGRNPAAGQTSVDGGVEVGSNASGTSNWRGGWSWVGERGPELMKLPSGTQIKSNARSGSSGNAYTINVSVSPGGDPVSTASAIVDLIKTYERHYGRSWRAA